MHLYLPFQLDFELLIQIPPILIIDFICLLIKVLDRYFCQTWVSLFAGYGWFGEGLFLIRICSL